MRYLISGCLLLGVVVFGCTRQGSEPSHDSGSLMNVTEENFQQVVLHSEKPVLVDFWAEWCGPCKMIAPTVEEVAAEFEGQAVVVKLDVDAAPGIAQRYNVSGIPTLIVFSGGREVARQVGIADEKELSQMLNQAL